MSCCENNIEEFRRYPYPHRRRLRRHNQHRVGWNPYYFNNWWSWDRPINIVKVVNPEEPKQEIQKKEPVEYNNLMYMLFIIIIISLVMVMLTRK